MNPYIQLAQTAIEEYINKGKIISVPNNLPREFYEKQSGVFVTIRIDKNLRGCIGTYLPARKNIAEEIIQNAISACSQDNRFPPITREELPLLDIEVSLLSNPQKITNLKELDQEKFGVIVKCRDGRCGLLLPNLEGVDSVKKQLTIACQKGGIDPNLDKDLEIYKFSVTKFSGEK